MTDWFPRVDPPGFSLLHAELEAIRSQRFAEGLRCPHCAADGPIRWGHFGARQRYRCKACRRTFSDLTGTPAAYTKKLLLWSAYGRCMAEGLSVRKAAARVGIDKTTAFRWRHAILGEARKQSNVLLSGWVEFAFAAMAYSEKGRRGAPGDAHGSMRPRDRWVRGNRTRFGGRRIGVAFACDRHGRVFATVCNRPRPTGDDLSRRFTGRFQGTPTLVAKQGRAGPVAVLATRLEAAFVNARRSVFGPARPFHHTDTALAYRFRFFDWMIRFHGVATRYLPNYLTWFDHVDQAFRNGPSRSLLRWPLQT